MERKLRFTVGVVVGGLFGLYLVGRLDFTSDVLTVGVIAGSALLTGVLAWWYGDRHGLG